MDAGILIEKVLCLLTQGVIWFVLKSSSKVRALGLTVIKAVEKEQPRLVAFCEHQ